MVRKDKIKLKKHEIEFKSKRIDARRFAYDVIKYSALKFGVPECCIAVCKGSDNDYGCSDFCMDMFRTIFNKQIGMRYEWYAYFNQRYESNKLESYELIRRLFQDVINEYTSYPLREIKDVEVSLSIACELVLFLYSKNLNLHLNLLAERWFDCYFYLAKKQFDKAGGLDKLYLEITTEVNPIPAFNDKFIAIHCLPYEDSAKNKNLEKLYIQLLGKHSDKMAEYFLQMQCKETDDIFVREFSREDGITEYEIVMLPVSTDLNEASAKDISQDGNIGTKFQEFLRTDSALFFDAALSHAFPGASPKDQSSICSEEIRNPVCIEAQDEAQGN